MTALTTDSLTLAEKVVLRWHLQRRPSQTPSPDPDWLIWLILAGRGFGKTRTGAEDSTEFLLFPPFTPTTSLRLAVVAPTFASGRDVCIEGESGLLNTIPQPLIANWNRSLGELNLHPNPPHNPFPSLIRIYSAEDPEALRGPQHHRAWCDELAAWRHIQDTWDMLMMGLRLGPNPRAVITTTPKRKPLLVDLLQRPTTRYSTGSTFENQANLSPAALDELRRRYEGTRLGRQELYAELLSDVEGALFSQSHFDDYRLPLLHPSSPYLTAPNVSDADRRAKIQEYASHYRDYAYHSPGSLARDYVRVTVAVDPAVTTRRTSNLTGIIVAARTAQSYPSTSIDGLHLPPSPHCDVLADLSLSASPDVWARQAITAYHTYSADHITAEANNGGDLVSTVIHGIDPTVPVRLVHASHGKTARAEPVVAVYDQGRVHHPLPLPARDPVTGDYTQFIAPLRELEDQCTTWEPLEDPVSPDRLDALVWAITDLLSLDARYAGSQTQAGTYRDTRLRGRR